MSNRRVTIQITLDLRAVVLLSVVLLLLGLIIAPTVAGAFPRRDDPEPQFDAQNAHKVDNHHAGPSDGTLNQRKNRVLWAQSNGQLAWKAMPVSQLNNRYLNDDRQETISAAVEGTLLTISNTGSGSGVYGLKASGEDGGVYGFSLSGAGAAVYGKSNAGIGVHGHSTGGYGVHGRSDNYYGAYFQGSQGSLILGGAGDGDNGTIHSYQGQSSSDLVFYTNDEFHVHLDENSDEIGSFRVYNGANTLVFQVKETGEISHKGALIGAFPRPAYNSEWVSIGQDQWKTFNHNLGGNPDDYVVDMTCSWEPFHRINQWNYGGYKSSGNKRGAAWSYLNNTQVKVYRFEDDSTCDKVRIRIWVYK